MNDASDLTGAPLAEAAALAEQGFLAMGQSLEQAIGILDRLTDRFATYIAELGGEAFSKLQSDLAAGGGHVTALAEARRSDAAAFNALSSIIETSDQRVAALRPITDEVGVLSLTARVVAGGMGLAAADFATFAIDISTAGRHAHVCLTEAHDALGRVDHVLAAANAEAGAFTRRHGRSIEAIPTRLAGNLRGLEAQRRLVADTAAEAHRRSDDVRRQVAEQIVALQLGDVIRQRIEHVSTAAQYHGASSSQPRALLASQLIDAADELAREGERIETGLRGLAQMASAVGQLGARALGGTGDASLIAALEADIGQTATLLGELRANDPANDQRITALLDAAGELAAQLTRVQSVQEDIRLMGLNATLKCGRLGAIGRPLAVVAQELRLCSGRFGANAAQVLRDLDRLPAIAATLRDPSRPERRAEFERATDALLASLRRMRELECDLASALAGLQDEAAAVGQLVDAALGRFAIRHELIATMRAAATRFTVSTDATPCPPEIFDRIAAGYTMAREREIHRRFAPLPAEQDDASDILF